MFAVNAFLAAVNNSNTRNVVVVVVAAAAVVVVVVHSWITFVCRLSVGYFLNSQRSQNVIFRVLLNEVFLLFTRIFCIKFILPARHIFYTCRVNASELCGSKLVPVRASILHFRNFRAKRSDQGSKGGDVTIYRNSYKLE